MKNNLTIVSGLWNIGRTERSFDEIYVARFKSFLKIDRPMILFLPEELHEIVWEIRKPENTFVKTFELEEFKSNYFSPHWNNFERIRKSDKWQNITGEGGWLKNSPQLKYEWYNPIVMSKMCMLHDASIFNSFNTEYFYWIDAGLNITVHDGLLLNNKFYENVIDYTDPFIFVSFPYRPAGEIHGFDQKAAEKITGTKIEYVCRGGFFGGHKDQIREANSVYYGLVESSLKQGYMGTEESIFTLMSYIDPLNYRRCEINTNGLLYTFFENVVNETAKLVDIPKTKSKVKKEVFNLNKYKTNLYILTFNFPEQVSHTIESMKKVPTWLEKPSIFLLDNSTDKAAKEKNKEICKENNFEYIDLGGNTGICGGRQFAAEHFHNSDADFYFFFEDDMTSNPPELEGQFCRNGLRKYIPNLYEILHKIILKEDFDYLKLSFTEVYWDNNIQTSWYNVPQDVRSKFWPDYDKLPVTGKDPNAPRTQFNIIDNVDGVAYIDGDITYTNWPMIMSKKGNQKVFIDVKWAHPYEQTWMSYVFQEQKKGNIRAGVLLASPIWHERIKYYKPEERREN